MATTPLRPFIREIEAMIDQGQTEEAIAHSRHILKTLPKNLATYRLLGKAFLETQRYGDAADIFLRVLSAVPDDFVSHVGMSIIREDEGHPDAAIWHMERAFEVQPYNSAIQDELRRLYGRRDGIEPPKVRLTRGALARMYARGDLYQQAMNELRTALLEDPQRTDLQVLLARMYYLSDQKVEAVDVCSKLLKKLPNCLEANRIIAAILPETERKDEAPAYQNRVAALDPYMALVSPRAVDAGEIPDQSVMIERLDVILGELLSEQDQPTWASSLGVAIEPFGSPKDTLPDWLIRAEDELEEASIEEQELPFEEMPSEQSGRIGDNADQDFSAKDADLPEWMKEAGWEVSESGEGEMSDFLEMEADLEEDEDELPQGEIPDWLRDMAPPGTIPDEEITGEGDETLFPWMQGVPGNGQKEALESSLDEIELSFTDGNGSEKLDVASSGHQALEQPEGAEEAVIAPEDGIEIAPETSSDFELPDWLADIEPKVKPLAEDFPDWLVDTQPEASQEVDSEFELPDWLAGLQPALEEIEDGQALAFQAGDVAQEMVEEEAVPAVQAEAPSEVGVEMVEEAVEAEAGDELTEWLAGLGPPVESGDVEGELEAEFEAALEAEAGEELPDWLAEIEVAGEGAGEEAKLEAEFEAALEAEAGEELPDWLAEIETAAEVKEEGSPWELDLVKAQKGEEPPDWLEDVGTSTEVYEESLMEVEAESELAADETSLEADEVPWLQDMEPAEEPVLAAIDEDLSDTQPVRGDMPPETFPVEDEMDFVSETTEERQFVEDVGVGVEGEFPVSELVDDDEAMAWLESLAAKHGVPEEELITKPEDRVEQPPDWVADMEVEGEQIDALPVEAVIEEVEGDVQSESIPYVHVEEMNLDAGEQVFEEELEPIMEQAAKEEIPSIELPDWLFEIDTTEEVTAQPAVVADEVEDMEEELDFQPVQSKSVTEAEDYEPLAGLDLDAEDEAMAWLEGLAAKHGVPEEELITLPEERPVQMPDWIQEIEEEEQVVGEVEPEQDIFADLGDDSDWIVEEDTPEVGYEREAELIDQAELIADSSEEEPVEAASMESAPVELEQVEAAGEEIPAWLQEMAQEEYESAVPEWLGNIEKEEQQEPQAETGFSGVNLEDEDAALGWLEGLAAKQGIPEEELITRPEERSEEIPEWLEEIETEKAAAFEEAAETISSEEEDWILAAERAALSEIQEEDDLEEAGSPELPGWLADLEQPEEETSWSPPQFEEEEAVSGITPEKLPVSLLDLNQASLIELEETPGIGFRLAQRIVEHRQTKGAFRNLEELEQVPGVSRELISELKDMLFVTVPVEAPDPRLEESPPEGSGPEWDLLVEARTSYTAEPQESLEKYSELIRQGMLLEEVIRDLQASLQSEPEDFGTWMALGDALNRNEQPKDAMDAYIRAEQLLR
jgi:competence ComEA-like helix-hairpin-helix protein